MQPRSYSVAFVLTVAAVTGPAYAQTYENETGGTVRFYGQFSPTYLGFDDGVETTDVLADNANSNTRLGFVITQPFGVSGLTLTFEAALGLVQTSEISTENIPAWMDWQRTDLRKFEAAYAGSFGTFTFGQGSMATDGAATLDASGTTMAGTVTFDDTAGSFAFRQEDGALSDITIGAAFKDFDGSRRFRLRYDTPTWSGFTLAAAYGQNTLADGDETDYQDVALRWSGTVGDFDLDAAAGYAWAVPETGDTTQTYMGSGTVTHTPTGLNLTIASGGQDGGARYSYLRAGWQGDLISVGKTSFSADLYTGTNFVSEGATSDSWGIYAQQNFDDLKFEAYVGWRTYAYDDNLAGDFLAASSILIGLRTKF